MSGQTGRKSSQFNKAQNQYLGNLGGFANQASATGERMLGGVEAGLGGYERAIGDLGAMGQANLERFINTPGYTPQEQQGMRSATTIPMASAFNTAAYQNSRNAALTGNTGATTAANAQLAREKARMMSGALGGLQQQFGDARRQDTQAGVNAMPTFMNSMSSAFQFPSSLRASLYNANLDAQQNALAMQQGAVGAYANRAAQPGFLKQAALTGIQGLVGGMGQSLGGLVIPQRKAGS